MEKNRRKDSEKAKNNEVKIEINIDCVFRSKRSHLSPFLPEKDNCYWKGLFSFERFEKSSGSKKA